MVRIVSFLLLALSIVSCASMKLVETVQPPEVEAFQQPKTITLVVEKIGYPGPLLTFYQRLPGNDFFSPTALVEYRHYPNEAIS